MVLVAEDEVAIRKLLCTILKKHQIETVAVEDGVQALERASSGNFDAIVLDLMMPNLSGWVVLEELNRQGCPLAQKVIVITAAGENKTALLPAGVRLLRKPFDINQLVEAVQETLGLKSATPDAAPDDVALPLPVSPQVV
jgi:two-component system response regulator MprA